MEAPLPTRADVLALIDRGLSYGAVADRLNINAGLAYMIATGLPADGGDALTEEDKQRPGFVESSTQHLSNPQPPDNPTTNDSVLRWIKQRAHTDPPMLRVAADRNAEPGKVEDPADDKDLVTVLTRDHDQVVALMQQLSAVPSHKKGGSDWQIQRRESIADMMARRLTVHEQVEDKQLWPLVRKTLADGDRWAADGRRQEQETAQTLVAIRAAEPDSDEFDELVEKLTEQLRKHVAHEERVFLMLGDAVSEEQRQGSGRKAVRTRRVAAAKQEITDPTPMRPARRKGKAPGEARAKKSEAADAEHGAANTSPDDG